MGGIRHTPSPEQVAHLQALGLPASLAALQRGRLKAAFLTAALQWHPDRHAGVAAKASAEARFKVVKEAYEALLPQAVA
jgi:DnaJ-class molecular chaperone